MVRAQSSQRADFVRSIVVDVHAWILEPSRIYPIDEGFKGNPLLAPAVRPPIVKVEPRLLLAKARSAKKIFQAAGNEGIAFHIKKDICPILSRQSGEATHTAAFVRLQYFISW